MKNNSLITTEKKCTYTIYIDATCEKCGYAIEEIIEETEYGFDCYGWYENAIEFRIICSRCGTIYKLENPSDYMEDFILVKDTEIKGQKIRNDIIEGQMFLFPLEFMTKILDDIDKYNTDIIEQYELKNADDFFNTNLHALYMTKMS